MQIVIIMDTKQTRHAVATAIGRLSESMKKFGGEKDAAWKTIRETLKEMGGKVRFSMPPGMKEVNNLAIEEAYDAAKDEETRKYLESWRGPLYGEALRNGSFGVEYVDSAGNDAYAIIDALSMGEDGHVSVEAVDEDRLETGEPAPELLLMEGDISDPMPVLLFLESNLEA